MNSPASPSSAIPRRGHFLFGVFAITVSVLAFQIVQTRILSVIAWYYLAFFAISVAMLGMTAGAVWVYMKRPALTPDSISVLIADSALLTAISMPLSIMIQFSLITTLLPTVMSIFSWTLLLSVMALPYVFSGIAISVALTRSPFPVGQVYGVDLLGAATGCAAVIGILDLFDGPSAVLFAGILASLSAYAFAEGATEPERQHLHGRARWKRPLFVAGLLAASLMANLATPYGFKPMLVKDKIETGARTRFERWNSYSRVVAYRPAEMPPAVWGPSPYLDVAKNVQQVSMHIDGEASTAMNHFHPDSLEFLKHDIVNLAYYLPGLSKSAVIGVGGGRDIMAASVFGVRDITGVELNPIFIDLLTKHPLYAPFANIKAIPGLRFHIDDARSWFASTKGSFDLIQMSMIDTWAATGAGAFSLSENGLYTLEGWRTFIGRLRQNGVFTVSRWYSPDNINESGRMIALAMGALIDRGVADPRRHIFVAHARTIATLILSKEPFTEERLNTLHTEAQRLGFSVLISPDATPESPLLHAIVSAKDIAGVNSASSGTYLDLSVPTDNKPFFFNQLRFGNIPRVLTMSLEGNLRGGVIRGNLRASITLVIIFCISLLAVVLTIVLPLRASAQGSRPRLVATGTVYFTLIGLGFMLAEISLLQYFGIFLGHPIYAMGVCLFSLILSSGVGSLTSAKFPLNSFARIAVWSIILGLYFILAQWGLPLLIEATSSQSLFVRIAISLAAIMPVGFLMGFAFPTGMSFVQKIDDRPTPWFWGINGAAGVLASVVAVMISMTYGINVTMLLAGFCYLALALPARFLLDQSVR